jgi:cytochrome oxidase Cu insertion factor (SCO1/SenC/PrrC family)/thiol-disulfide isomerase/thioredoxin
VKFQRRVPRQLRAATAVILAAALVAGSMAPAARADGDPGSDVLVYQDLFTGSAGISVRQQLQFSALLKAAARAGFPVRVAIIASPTDLGAVTSLWRNPRAYAKFLGLELSLAYKQRLLVVMPNGFGFSWPKHSAAPAYELLRRISIGSGANGLLGAAQTAVQQLAKVDGVKLPSVASEAAAGSPAAGTPNSGPASNPGRAADNGVAIAVVALAALILAGFGIRWALRRRGASRRGPAPRERRRPPLAISRGQLLPAAVVLFALVVAAPILILAHSRGGATAQRDALAFNPYLDPGTPVARAAPDFTLSDQFGQRVSLHSFRGKVVILAFNDSECTTECPLTTSAMLDAKAMLGAAGSRVQLLGIDANPAATSLEDVWSYSELHGMQHAWHFLTGSRPELARVWKQYGVEAAIERGQITHTPALFVIDPRGREARIYITQMSYSAIGQLGQLLAQEASILLPSHPRVHSEVSYSRVPPITPAQTETLPRAGGGSVQLGPGSSAHLYLFFASWDRETSALSGQLDALNSYAAAAARLGLPPVTAVDEGSVEPSSRTLGEFLRSVPHRLSYPVAIDRTGRVADGYEVLGVPWFVLVSGSGQILYYRSVSTAGWPSRDVLIRYMRVALARAPRPPATGAPNGLSNSPPALAALHQQANKLLGSQAALTARIRALRGHPIVINAWASWCGPCRSEFGLFASASARFGQRVAFLGANTNDSAGDARSFLAQHPVGYPSYETTIASMQSLAVLQGLPTTIFINPAGKVVFVHTGQYDTQGTLDQDVSSYALTG